MPTRTRSRRRSRSARHTRNRSHFNADGSFDYTPVADFNGTDTFTYVANDGTYDSNVATVTITVHPVNDAPVAVDDSVRATRRTRTRR